MLTKINICWKRARRFITRHLLWVKLGLCGDVYKKPAVSKYTLPAALRVRALSSAAAWASHAVFFPLNVCFHPPMQGSHLAQWSGLLELESNWLKFYHVPAQWCCHHYQMFLMRTHRHPLSGFPFFSFLFLGDSPELIKIVSPLKGGNNKDFFILCQISLSICFFAELLITEDWSPRFLKWAIRKFLPKQTTSKFACKL